MFQFADSGGVNGPKRMDVETLESRTLAAASMCVGTVQVRRVNGRIATDQDLTPFLNSVKLHVVAGSDATLRSLIAVALRDDCASKSVPTN